MLKVKRGTKGFTLIELLIVIAIIGILAAIAIPAYTGYTKKSKIAGVVNAMGAVKNAVTAYYTEQGSLNNLNLTDANAVQNTLGISFPTQYATGITVTSKGTDGVLINVTLNTEKIGNVGGNGLLVLSGTNLGGNPQWDWNSSDVDNSYKPKGQ